VGAHGVTVPPTTGRTLPLTTRPEASAAACSTVAELDAAVVDCRACPRLVAWREQVAHERRAAYAEEDYWGRPVPGFGDPSARVLVVGLAPAAHGANRTGRMFTGDRSGDWLFAALHRAGLAAQPTSTSRVDGQRLAGVRVTSAVHCAPPGNAPSPQERDTCAPWLVREIQLCRPRVIVALGGFAWTALLRDLAQMGAALPTPRPRFGHGAECFIADASGAADGLWLLGCYHPSQQNTFTGRLTAPMLDDVLGRARALAGEA
jgi:uracil-DNA glycosylase